MGIIYNADEIYEIALHIEENGKKFYDAAAEKVPEENVRKLLLELSSWELRHIDLFKDLRKGLKDKLGIETSFDADDLAASYITALADSHVFVQNFDLSVLIDRCKSGREVLETALRFEKDSVIYYAAVKDLVPAHLGRDDVSKIELEEIRHVSFIYTQLRTFSVE